jgi:alkylation response protein AidB-like acyl-CoA dehydrogenase
MDLELTSDQAALRDELRRFLAGRFDPDTRRACADQPGAVDRAAWKELASMGVFSLTLAEADGGVGLGLAEAAIVFEELGRAAVPGPLVATFLAATLGGDLAEAAAAGDAVVGAVARAEPAVVEHLDALDALLVLSDGAPVVAGRPGGRRLERPLDPLTPVHLVDSLPAGATVGDHADAARLQRDGSLLVAAMQVGLGEAAVALATGYAKERQQFGKPIGSFQAVKHLLAEAHVWVDVARAAVHAAAVELDEAAAGGAPPGSTCGVDAARLVASEAAAGATATCVQVHGGMGFTWEVDAHLLLKRAAVLDVAFGSAHDACEARADALAVAARSVSRRR